MWIRLENCGTRDYTLDGYPLLDVLDKNRSLVEGVQTVHGSGGVITPVPGSVSRFDEPPRPLVLKPGESASSELMWRYESVTLPYLRVRAQPGADPVTLTLHLDLGTTGTLAVSPWARPPASAAPANRAIATGTTERLVTAHDRRADGAHPKAP